MRHSIVGLFRLIRRETEMRGRAAPKTDRAAVETADYGRNFW
jgi:hypothetical protein